MNQIRKTCQGLTDVAESLKLGSEGTLFYFPY